MSTSSAKQPRRRYGFFLLNPACLGSAFAFFVFVFMVGAGCHAQEADGAKSPPVLGTYQLVSPSVGLLQTTHRAPLAIEGGQAKISLDDTMPPLSAGMKVILLDAQANVLPDAVTIETVTQDSAYFTLPEKAGNAHEADIVLMENAFARRVPLQALQADAIWRAAPLDDRLMTVEKITLPAPLARNADYLDVGGSVRADEFIVLNPDGALQDGALITAQGFYTADAPALDPQQKAALNAREDEAARMKEALPHTICFPDDPNYLESAP